MLRGTGAGARPSDMEGVEMTIIGTVPRSLDTPMAVQRLMVAVATWGPEEGDVRGFLHRACLATPAQARSSLRRIAAGIDTFESALCGPACGSTRKGHLGRTNRAGSSGNANEGSTGRKSK